MENANVSWESSRNYPLDEDEEDIVIDEPLSDDIYETPYDGDN